MPLERQIIARLTRAGQTLACAESCTGGLVAARLTSVPGSSAAFLGGVVAYANDVKRELLGVPNEVLTSEGAVSSACAAAMAEGARRRLRADWAVSTTGIAGPGGATAAKPVGLVFIAVAGPDGARVEKHLFAGGRASVRRQTVEAVLAMLIQSLRRRQPRGGRTRGRLP
ncbi:MAG: CinA family protein [Kiritimatiellae bacterium]|nr:CinA family protein [Kiritimatiellia bacterium]